MRFTNHDFNKKVRKKWKIKPVTKVRNNKRAYNRIKCREELRRIMNERA